MADPQEVVIVGTDGKEHVFPAGFDPKRASDIVRQQSAAAPQPQAKPQAERSWLDSAGDYFGEALQSINPKAINEGVQRAFWHPVDTVKAMGAAQGQLKDRAEEAFKRGDYAEGLRHSLEYLIPVFGPRMSQAGDHAMNGETAKAMGATTDVALQALGPKIVAESMPARLPAIAANTNAAEAAAVESLQRGGVPVSAGAATGNRFVRGVQELADTSPVGSVIAERSTAAQARGLATMGDQLRAKANPIAVTPEQAGTAVRQAVQGNVTAHGAAADTAYTALRAIEAKRPITVDLSAAKGPIEQMYSTIARGADIAPLQGSRAAAARAMARILQGPDVEAASVVDSALSDLKALQRETKGTPGAAAVNAAVDQVHRAVLDAVTKAGPDALKALNDGRSSTTAKYVAQDVLDGLNAEPVRTTNALTAPKDSAIVRLREIAKQAPQTLPQIGRSVLDGFLDRATEAGGFAHADRLYTDWQKLGPETKSLLFKDPGYIKALDDFFLGAKALLKPENTSKSALVAHSGAQVALVFTNPAVGVPTVIGSGLLSKLLHSPSGVRLLSKGLRLPKASTTARTAYAAELSKAIGDVQGTTQMVPALADSEGSKR